MSQSMSLYRQGVQAIRREQNLAQGRKLLMESLSSDPNNDMAWLWLSQTLSSLDKQLQCVERALRINPANSQALKLQERLASKLYIEEDDFVEETLDDNEIASVWTDYHETAEVEDVEGYGEVVDEEYTDALVEEEAQTGPLGRRIFDAGTNPKVVRERLGWTLASLVFTGALVAAWSLLPAELEWRMALLIPMLVGVLLTGGLFVIFVMVFGRRVVIFEDGLEYTQDGKTVEWNWREFDEVCISQRVRNRVVYRVVQYEAALLRDGEKLVTITRLQKDCHKIGDHIMKLTAPVYMNRYLRDFRDGKTLAFGAVEVDRKGIRSGKQSLSWEEVGYTNVDKGVLIVSPRYGHTDVKVPYLTIPNGYVMVKTVERIAEIAREHFTAGCAY